MKLKLMFTKIMVIKHRTISDIIGATAFKNLTRKGATFVISMDGSLLTFIRTEDKGGGDSMRSVHGDKLRCINYSMLCKVRSF